MRDLINITRRYGAQENIMTRQDLQKTEESKITTIFNPSDYKTFEAAMEQLEFLARDNTMPETLKTVFNRNFYGFIALTGKHFDLDFEIIKDVAKGIAKLSALSPDEADKITLIGDDDKYCLKLLDSSGKYKSTFNPESGKCRFPSHWFTMYHVVMVNNL
jgi:hypothetical protein